MVINPLVILAFFGVTAVVGLVAFKLRGSEGQPTATRLDLLVGKRKADNAPDLLKRTAFEGDKRTFLESIAARIPNIERTFEQADCHIKPASLLAVCGVLALVGMTGSWLAGIPIYFWPLSGSVLGCIPLLWLWNKRRVRLKQFAGQLPYALELVARALRAGHSLGAGMHVVAEEMPSPISDEFSRVYEEQNLGIPLEEAMRSMTERVPNLDLRFFVTSVAIQRQTGGDLAEIIDKIGYVVRERYRILGQVKALTAEGRLSGIVLIALPFLLFLVMLHIKADYVSMLWTHETGRKMSLFALVMQVVGAGVIKKIVDIK